MPQATDNSSLKQSLVENRQRQEWIWNQEGFKTVTPSQIPRLKSTQYERMWVIILCVLSQVAYFLEKYYLIKNKFLKLGLY